MPSGIEGREGESVTQASEIALERAQSFTLNGTPLLSAGQTMDLLARGPHLWLHAKVYAAGGENGLHAHPAEDHAFLILAGEATFTDADGAETVVGPHDGMLIPRGTEYRFESSGKENLVMLRVGAGDTKGESVNVPYPEVMVTRTGVQPHSAENKTGSVPGVPLPGRTFGSASR